MRFLRPQIRNESDTKVPRTITVVTPHSVLLYNVVSGRRCPRAPGVLDGLATDPVLRLQRRRPEGVAEQLLRRCSGVSAVVVAEGDCSAVAKVLQQVAQIVEPASGKAVAQQGSSVAEAGLGRIPGWAAVPLV